MKIKISEDKLDLLKDVVFDGLNIDKHSSFQSRSINTPLIEFLTPDTRKDVISRYYPDLNLAVVNNEKFYDLISGVVGSHNVYDLIKDDLIKQIFQVYTERFKSRDFGEIRSLKYRSDEEFNKK